MLGISTLLLALIASAANAAPLSEQPRGVKLTGCSITGLQLSLPASASVANMQLFTSESPTYVLLGRGVQNYTCTGGVYASNMAVADLFDASCVANSPLIASLPQLALSLPYTPGKLKGVCKRIIGSLKFGDHYFQKLTPDAAGANPVFDLRATRKGGYAAFKKDTSVPDPSDPAKNVAWLQLSNIEGSLATHVYRTATAGGVAPATCTQEGKVITVDYATLYYLYK